MGEKFNSLNKLIYLLKELSLCFQKIKQLFRLDQWYASYCHSVILSDFPKCSAMHINVSVVLKNVHIVIALAG